MQRESARDCEGRGGRGPKGGRLTEPWLSGCQVLSGDLSGCRAAVRHCQVPLSDQLSGAVSAVRCCQVLSGACLTGEVICSCRVLSELSGVAVRRCRSCQSCQAAAAVRRWAVAVRCCQVVLSGCCQALTHTSHTYDTIKRRPAGLYYTYSQPLLLDGVHAGGGGRLGSADGGAGAGGGGGTDGGGHPHPDAVGI